MKNLLTPEGLAALSGQLGPIELKQGIIPFENHKQREEGVEQRPVGDRQVSAKVDMPGQDCVLFTLGPVYWSLGIPFDIVDQFIHSEYGKGAMVQRIALDRNILPSVPGWESLIEAINQEVWDNFVLFLSECMFTRNANYWTLCGDFCSVQIAKRMKPVPVAVFTPRGLNKRIQPMVSKGQIQLFETGAAPVAADDYSRKLNLIVEERS